MDKPFKTIAEQENILRSRGMETSSSTQEILMREGYYSVVNGYKDPFIDKQKSRENGHDVFIDGTTFDDLYELFKFDRELRLTLFKYFSMAEETLKTTSSYVFCERHSKCLVFAFPAGSPPAETRFTNAASVENPAHNGAFGIRLG